MRRKILFPRDFRSNVQITSVSNFKDVIRQVANGVPVELNVNGTSGSFDFDGVDVDFDKPVVEDAPNKIDQHFYKARFISQALSASKDTPPVEDSPTPEPPPAEA